MDGDTNGHVQSIKLKFFVWIGLMTGKSALGIS